MNSHNLLNTAKSMFVAATILTAPAFADQVSIDQIERAASSMNIPALNELAKSAQDYDLALAQYRLSISANQMGQGDMATSAIDAAIDTLETLEQASPDDVEVKALLAQVYGYKIALEPLKGIYYGPKAQSALEQAEALSPNNPRVLLFKGIGAINTPPMFGGSKDKALAAFSQAIVQFEQDRFSDFHWGYAEAYTWRGLVYMQQDDAAKAIADWNKALEVEPDYGWAMHLLSQVKS